MESLVRQEPAYDKHEQKMTEEILVSTSQEDGIRRANTELKKVFPNENMQICFNLAHAHDTVNYNIKKSGILRPAKT